MKAGFDEVVKILIAAGADLNIAANHDIPGYTAIMIAKKVSYMMFTILFIYKQQVSTTFLTVFNKQIFHCKLAKVVEKNHFIIFNKNS